MNAHDCDNVTGRVAAQETMQPGWGAALAPLLARARAQGKAVNWIEQINSDEDLLRRTAHVRRRGEKMMEFFARTGLGASQVRSMSAVEIERFCKTVAANEDLCEPPTVFVQAAPPPRFVLTE